MPTGRLEEILSLSPHEAAAALDEAIEDTTAVGLRCDCGACFDVLGDLTAAVGSPCPDCGGALELDP